MTVPPGEPRRDPPVSPLDAARRYPSPHQRATPSEPEGSSPDRHEIHEGDRVTAADRIAEAAKSPRLPTILGVAGIVGWFLCGWGAIGSVIVGQIGERRARSLGQRVLLPRIAWIGGVVICILDVIGFAVWLQGR